MADICIMNDLTKHADELIRNRLYNHQELAQLGFSRNSIHRLVSEGVLENPVSGIFHHRERDIAELDHLALIGKRYPDAVFNLYTAAKNWDMTQVETNFVWVSIPAARKKKITMGEMFELPIRTLLCDRAIDLQIGVVDVDILGQSVKMTSPERTIVDMWRMSTISGDRHPNRIVIRDESLFQSFGAYLEKNNGNAGPLADIVMELDLGEKAQNRFFDFAKTYTNAFEAQRTI
jgi:hypothetical protein